MTSKSVWVDPVTSMYLSGTVNVSSFGTQLNSRFIVMTIDEVTLDRPEVGTGFSVICCLCRLRLSRFALTFCAEIFAPYGRFPPWSGFSEFVVSFWPVVCTPATGNTNSSSFFFVLSILLSRWFLEDTYLVHQIFQIFQIRTQNISFPKSLRDQLISKEDPK